MEDQVWGIIYCIEIFRNKKEYDYLIPIDGDDFVYPYGLCILEKSMINQDK